MECFFGATGKKDKVLLQHYLANSNVRHVKWALTAPLVGKTKTTKTLFIFTALMTRSSRFLKNVKHKIKGGGHFMVYNRAEEIG